MSAALDRLRTKQAIQRVEGLLGYDISVLGAGMKRLLRPGRSATAVSPNARAVPSSGSVVDDKSFKANLDMRLQLLKAQVSQMYSSMAPMTIEAANSFDTLAAGILSFQLFIAERAQYVQQHGGSSTGL